LPLYIMQLQNLPQTHPGAVELLRNNGFSVARSTVPGCRNAVDITIEQTINRSAKTSGGVIGFSRNTSAYHRWCVTRHMRAMYAHATLDRADIIAEVNDVHRALRPSEIKSSETAIDRILNAFNQFINPFAVETDRNKSLYCLSSGQPASAEVARDLLQYASVIVQWTDGDILPQELVDILASTGAKRDESETTEEEIEEDYEVDNVVDVVFEDDEDDYIYFDS